MRELKFRVWSEETKSFEHFDLNEGTECGLTNLQIWARNNPIEQYTGLKDKNGKEIYEGDVVRYPYRKDYIGQIVFGFVKDSEGYYIEKHYGWGICSDGFNMSLGDYADDNMGCELIEVIGNIHENPELLNVSKAA